MNIFEIIEKFFCCPFCEKELLIKRTNIQSDGFLTCSSCRRSFIILNNIPIMLTLDYVEDKLKNIFFKRHPELLEIFYLDSIDTEKDDVKQHQIETWSKQYAENNDIERIISGKKRYMPSITAHTQSIFRNNTKLFHNTIFKGCNKDIFLDIGCGTGSFTQIASENFKLYFGIDISYDAVLNCYEKYPYENCVYFVGDAENMPIKGNSVNICASQWLFEHLKHPEKCSNEIFRILKSKGRVYIDTNHTDFILTYRWFQMVLTPQKYQSRMKEAGHSHERFFSKKRLKDILTNSKFKKIKIRLCYFLFDMLIHKVFINSLVSLLFSPSDKQNKGFSILNECKSGETLDFFQRENFNRIYTFKDRVKLAINVIYNVIYYILLPDRIIEVFGNGESIIAIAEKE